MPYKSISELPPSVRDNLPIEAQVIYMSAFNTADKLYPDWDDDKKSQYAWGAVKKVFHKIGDKWVKLSAIDLGVNLIIYPELAEELAEWRRAYINELPDSSFAVIEPAYKRGEVKDKRCRHLPYKDMNGKVDIPHLRNALARMNQIVPVTDSISTEELRAEAKKVLVAVAKSNNIGDWE